MFAAARPLGLGAREWKRRVIVMSLPRMRPYLAIACLLGCATASLEAGAQETAIPSDTVVNVALGPGNRLLNVGQSASGAQRALNVVNGSNSRLQQRSGNVLNLISASDRSLAGVDQVVDAVDQAAVNRAGAPGQDLLNATQDAENVANVVDAANVHTVRQSFTGGSSQGARNLARVGASGGDLTQRASNTLNLASVTGAAAVIDQEFPNDAKQAATNVINAAGDVRGVTQEAVNIVNLVQGGQIGTIERSAAGAQVARNRVSVNGTASDVRQVATNIANLAVVDTFDTIRQTATGSQSAVNTLNVSGGTAATAIVQSSNNIANLTIARGQGGRIEQVTDVSTTEMNRIESR